MHKPVLYFYWAILLHCYYYSVEIRECLSITNASLAKNKFLRFVLHVYLVQKTWSSVPTYRINCNEL